MPSQDKPIQAHEVNLDEIIRSAAAGHEPDGYADLTDLHLHTCLTQLYMDYNAGRTDLDTCKRQKEMLVAAWKSDKDTLSRYRQSVTEWNEKIRLAEQTGKQLHKADSLRSFAADAAVLIEAVTGWTGLLEMVGKLS